VIDTLSTDRFEDVLHHLAEGDFAFCGQLSPALSAVPAKIAIGDLFVAILANQAVWYEVLLPPRLGQVQVRCYSRIFKRGDYDRVSVEDLTVCVTRPLFERARAHGFRTVRPHN